MTNEEVLKKNGGKKFDICLMNPPYANGLHEDFIEKVLNVSNSVVTVQPTSWVVGKKQSKRIISLIDNCLVNIEKINGNEMFQGVGYLNGEIGIVYIDKKQDKKVLYNGIEIDDIKNIKRYSDDKYFIQFNDIVKPLYEEDNAQKYVRFLTRKDNDENDIKLLNKYVIRYPIFVKGFKLFSEDTKIGLCKDLAKLRTSKGRGTSDTYYLKTFFAFDTEYEMQNCYNYLRTDFVDACLYLIKNTMHTDRGELKYIPWFDFKDEHFSKTPREIDDWLFKKYDISDEIRKHIEEILPDYYDIRK